MRKLKVYTFSYLWFRLCAFAEARVCINQTAGFNIVSLRICCGMLRYAAVCCGMLQYAAVCC